MGAMAEGITGYAQPLVDRTDGSQEQVEKALMIAMICWNLAIMPDAEHDEFLDDLRGSVEMDDAEFRGFRRDVIAPMIRRHREMFPGMDPTRRQMLRNEPQTQ